jgi:putative hemolysin
MSVSFGDISVRMTRDDAEVRAAQALRYKVFYEEYGAKADPKTAKSRLDQDIFDSAADHMIVVKTSPKDGQEEIIGTYRMLSPAGAAQIGRYYSADEYDLSNLKTSEKSLLELGRSCVLKAYRTRPVMQLLWQGIAEYVLNHRVDIMFGCASFSGTDLEQHANGLSYLYHYHKTPQNICPRAIEARFVDMNIIPKEHIDQRRAFAALPPLIKGYLRLGATIGDGAVIDEQFNTIDVCIIVQTETVSARYKKHYERKNKAASA